MTDLKLIFLNHKKVKFFKNFTYFLIKLIKKKLIKFLNN